jgi:hypothetical protein
MLSAGRRLRHAAVLGAPGVEMQLGGLELGEEKVFESDASVAICAAVGVLPGV